jgi:hypothetical protein
LWTIPLEKFDEQTWQGVDECRRLVGYQESPDWECPKFTHGDDDVCSQHPGKCAAGLYCYPYLVKEMQRQLSMPPIKQSPENPCSCSGNSQSFLYEYRKAIQEMEQKIEHAEKADTRRRLIALEKQIAKLQEMVEASMKRKRR